MPGEDVCRESCCSGVSLHRKCVQRHIIAALRLVGHVWVEDAGGAGNILRAPEADGYFLSAQKGKWRLEEELRGMRVVAGFRGIAAKQVKPGVEGSGPRVEVDALLMFEHADG